MADGQVSTPAPAEDVLVTPGVAAQMLGVSTKTIGAMVDAGTLVGSRTDGGHRRVSLASVTERKATTQPRGDQ